MGTFTPLSNIGQQSRLVSIICIFVFYMECPCQYVGIFNVQIVKVERVLLSNSYSRIHLLFSLLGPRNNGLNRETKVTGFKKGEGFIWQMAVVKGLFCTSILWWVPGDHKSTQVMHHIYSYFLRANQ